MHRELSLSSKRRMYSWRCSYPISFAFGFFVQLSGAKREQQQLRDVSCRPVTTRKTIRC